VFAKVETLAESVLERTGFSFLTLRQVFFLLFMFLLLGTSFNFNIGSSYLSGSNEVVTSNFVTHQKSIVNGVYSPTISQENRANILKYAVKSGDTVTSIASKFNVSTITIIAANNLVDDIIHPNQVLDVLPIDGIVHTIKSGDTISKIAGKYKSYGVNNKLIVRQNNIDIAKPLTLGGKLIIPGVVPAINTINRDVAYTDSQSVTYVPASKAPLKTGLGQLLKPTQGRLTQGFHAGHHAIDLANSVGTPIYAAESGKVIRAKGSGWNGGYGNNIKIQHPSGLTTLYAHLNVLNVKVGDTVVRGQQIAQMGNTGRSTGPHVHFEVIQGKNKLNPLQFIK